MNNTYPRNNFIIWFIVQVGSNWQLNKRAPDKCTYKHWPTTPAGARKWLTGADRIAFLHTTDLSFELLVLSHVRIRIGMFVISRRENYVIRQGGRLFKCRVSRSTQEALKYISSPLDLLSCHHERDDSVFRSGTLPRAALTMYIIIREHCTPPVVNSSER